MSQAFRCDRCFKIQVEDERIKDTWPIKVGTVGASAIHYKSFRKDLCIHCYDKLLAWLEEL